MAELDFSKIFASASPLTPYTWSDSDYMTGWNTVGGTPPARTQFDALQNMTDRKQKYLNDTKAPIDSPTFTGTPKAPTPAKSDRSTRIATTEWARQWVDELLADLSGYAPLNSPSFTGTPTAPTPSGDDNSTRIANTAWVKALVAGMSASDIVAFQDHDPWYVKFKNGFIIQGGYIQTCQNPISGESEPAPSTWQRISMPLTFPKDEYSLVANVDGSGASGGGFHSLFGYTYKLSSTDNRIFAMRITLPERNWEWNGVSFSTRWMAAGF